MDIENKIKNRTLIIPGKVAVMKGEIAEKLPGWNVVVGPTEAVQLPKYMKDKEYEAAAKAAAAEAAAKAAAAPAEEVKELSFEELLATKVPAIEVVDMGVQYKGHNPEAQTFVTIGERIHCISPVIRKAMDERDPAPILKRAAEQIAAGMCMQATDARKALQAPCAYLWQIHSCIVADRDSHHASVAI